MPVPKVFTVAGCRTLILSTVILFPALAQGFVVRSSDCSEWLEARQSHVSEGVENFVTGMLSGMSLASNSPLWEQNGNLIRREIVFFWLDDFCRKSPLRPLPEVLGYFANKVSGNAYERATQKAYHL